MTYIAIKNTEHKGVYKEKELNKDLYKTKGISYRKFKLDELNEALSWAGVKNIKNGESSTDSKNKKASISKNPALEIIMDYKNKGFEGVCITTKNFGEVILKINKLDIFICESLKRFNKDKDSLEEHLKTEFENAKAEKERYSYRTPYPFDIKFEIVRFDNLSKFSAINSEYITLSNFWSRSKVDNPFEDKQLMISRTVELQYNKGDLWTSYNNFTLSNNDIVSIQPLEFTLPRDKDGLGEYVRSYRDICRKMNPSEAKRIEKIFADAGAENLVITTRNNK